MNKDFYNKSSATQLGWEPSWFGEKYYDDKLVRAIKKFQKRYGLTADGLSVAFGLNVRLILMILSQLTGSIQTILFITVILFLSSGIKLFYGRKKVDFRQSQEIIMIILVVPSAISGFL